MPLCSFCAEPGHNIRTCSDIRIPNGWRDIIRRSKIHEGPLQEELLRSYLLTFPYRVLQGVSVQYAESLAQDSIDTQIDNICLAIHREAARYEILSTEEKNAFLHWMDPSTYLPDGTIIPDDDFPEVEWGTIDTPPDIEWGPDFIPFSDDHPLFSYLIEPLLLCLETNEELGQLHECPICFREEITLLDMNTTSCQHSFCHSCIMTHLKYKNNCPMCRASIKTLQVRHQEHYDNVNELFGPITKHKEESIQDDDNEHLEDIWL